MRISLLFFLLITTSQLLQAQANRYDPYKKFKFQLVVNSTASTLTFSEVSGLGIEQDIIEYRSGAAPTTSRNIPSTQRYGNIVLKRGTFAHSPRMTKYFKAVSAQRVKKESISIYLIDKSGKRLLGWTLINAHPMKYKGARLNASGNEVAIEEMVLNYEGIRRLD